MKINRPNSTILQEKIPEIQEIGFSFAGDWKPTPWKSSAQMQKGLTILSLYTHLVNTALSLHPYFKRKINFRRY